MISNALRGVRKRICISVTSQGMCRYGTSCPHDSLFKNYLTR